jgi:DNA repair protein REV1
MAKKWPTTFGPGEVPPPVGNHHGGSGKTYMQHKILKLHTSNDYHKVSRIFEGCYVFVNGYTDPPRNEIQRLVSINGGNFDSYQTSRTTHFICDIFPNTKLKELRKPKRVHIFYTTVQWLVKSVEEGRRLPEAEFLPQGLAHQHGVSMTNFFVEKAKPLLNTRVSNSSFQADIDTVSGRSSAEVLPVGHGESSVEEEEVGMGARAGSGCRALSLHAADPSTLHDSSLSNNKRSFPHSSVSSAAPSLTATAAPGAGLVAVAAPPPISSADPNFVQNYFETSRLHFIGSWKARLPALLALMQQEEKQEKGISVARAIELPEHRLSAGASASG